MDKRTHHWKIEASVLLDTRMMSSAFIFLFKSKSLMSINIVEMHCWIATIKLDKE